MCYWDFGKKFKKEKTFQLIFSSSLSPEALEIHGSFTWLGQTQYKLQLKSQEIHSLQLKACFVHTGVYNLGTPRVFAKLSDQFSVFETSQQNSMPALIIINDVWQLVDLLECTGASLFTEWALQRCLKGLPCYRYWCQINAQSLDLSVCWGHRACWTENTYILFLYFFKPW